MHGRGQERLDPLLHVVGLDFNSDQPSVVSAGPQITLVDTRSDQVHLDPAAGIAGCPAPVIGQHNLRVGNAGPGQGVRHTHRDPLSGQKRGQKQGQGHSEGPRWKKVRKSRSQRSGWSGLHRF